MTANKILTQGYAMCVPEYPIRSRDLIDADLVAAIKEIVAGHAPWPLFICGEAGTGKTCAALCMCDRYGGWFTAESDLCALVVEAKMGRAQTSAGYYRSVTDVWRDWGRASLAVLDEIGMRESISDSHYETVKNAIDKRAGKPLVVISNKSLDDISTIYDDRVASRLNGGSYFHIQTSDRRIGARWVDGKFQ